MGRPSLVLRVLDALPTDECVPWPGHLQPSGYAIARRTVDGREVCVRAHRAVYEAAVGPIPAGMQLDHLCRNRACCNPLHLEPVTATINVHRSLAVNRGYDPALTCPQGHPRQTDKVACRVCNAAASRRSRTKRLEADR